MSSTELYDVQALPSIFAWGLLQNEALTLTGSYLRSLTEWIAYPMRTTTRIK
jgi:hypothetical protein